MSKKTPPNISTDKLSENQFEENGVVYEKVTLQFPKQIVDFYRVMAHFNNHPVEPEQLIEYDIADHLKAEVEGRDANSWKELFNLTRALDVMADKATIMLG